MKSNIFKSIGNLLGLNGNNNSNINKDNILLLLKNMYELSELHASIYNDYTKDSDFLKFTIRDEFNGLSDELFILFNLIYEEFEQHLNIFEKVLRYNEVDFVITCNKQMLSFMDENTAKSILDLNKNLMKTAQHSEKDNNLAVIKQLLVHKSLPLAASALSCMQNYPINTHSDIKFDRFLNSNDTHVVALANKIKSEDPKCSLHDKMAYLHQIPLFNSISYNEIYKLAKSVKVVEFEPEEDIITQNEYGNSIYILTSGEVEIIIDNNRVNILDDGDYFGEIAIIAGIKRTATVRSLSDVITLRLSTKEFKDLIYDNPEISLEVMKEITNRLLENSKIH